MSSIEEKYKQVTDKLNLTIQHLKALEVEQDSLKAQIVKKRYGFGLGDIISDNKNTPIQVTYIKTIGDLIKDSKVFFGGFKQKRDGTIGKNPGYYYSSTSLKKIG